jgi:nucleotide-binding universal stress UspA family protein
MCLIKKILVALDGSESATNALNYALDLAEVTSAELELLTIIPPVFLPSYSSYVLDSSAIEDCAKKMESFCRGVLSKAQKEVQNKKPELKFLTKIEKGKPDEKIVKIAKDGNFDMIVMGCRGLGGRGDALGSVSSRVVDIAHCPVLIVK